MSGNAGQTLSTSNGFCSHFETLPDASLQNAEKRSCPPLVKGANTLGTLRIFERLRPATIAIHNSDLYARVSSKNWSVKNSILQMAGTIHSTNSLVKIFV